MAEAIIAGALKNIEHIAVFDRLAEERFRLIDTGAILTNLFDEVDSSLLDILASQMDMLGYNGWILAETDQEKRELLKGAVSLKKIMGTPGGIREVVQRLGFLDINIVEGWENFGDGTPEPGDSPWAYFKVKYLLPDNKGISEEIAQNLVGLINHYKNARSKLSAFSFGLDRTERVGLKGVLTLKTYTDGVLTATDVHENLIMGHGLKITGVNIIPQLGTPGRTIGWVDRVGFGTSAANPADGQVDLLTSPYIKDITPDDGTWINPGAPAGEAVQQLRFELGTSEANGTTIREIGLCMDLRYMDNTTFELETIPGYDLNRLFNRIVRAPIVKTSSIRLEGTWLFNFSNK